MAVPFLWMVIMLPSERRTHRTAVHSRLDHAVLVLLRLVTDPQGWDAERAARDLRSRLGDDRMLPLLRARVAHAMIERQTPTDDRALATLDHALTPARRTDPRPFRSFPLGSPSLAPSFLARKA